MTAYEDFLASPSTIQRQSNLLVEMDILDSGGSPVTLRCCSGTPLDGYAFRTAPGDSPAHTPYTRRLLNPLPSGTASIWHQNRIGGGAIAVDRDELRFQNADGFFDTYRPANGYKWLGGEVRLKWGSGSGLTSDPAFMAFADFGTPLIGQLGEPSYSFEVGGDALFTVPIYGLEQHFAQPIQSRVYRGTGFTVHYAAAAYGQPASNPAALNITGDLTYETWLNLDNLSAVRNLGGWIHGATRYPWQLWVSAAGRLNFGYTHSTGTAASEFGSMTIAAGSWYHVSVSVSGTAITMITYSLLDDEETVDTFTQAAGSRDANSGGTYQASRNHATLSMVGRLDETRVWNVARSRSEIRSHRNQPLATVPASCVALYRYDDASGTTATDDSATAADLTLNGTKAWYHSCQGEEELAGTVVPDCWGKAYDVTPRLVYINGQVYQVAGSGESVSSIEVYDGGEALTLDTAETNIYTFLAAVVTAGQYSTLLSHGLFKLGSNPEKVITAVVKGYDDGGAGYVETSADIVKRIAETRTRAPLAGGDIKAATFTALTTAAPYETGIFIDTRRTAADVFDELMQTSGAWWGYARGDDELQVHQFTGPAGTSVHDYTNRHIIAAEPTEKTTRVGELTLLYNHSYTRLSANEIAWASAGKAAKQRLERRPRDPHDGWSKLTVSDHDVLRDYPDARHLVVTTNIQNRDDATTEAARLLELYNGDEEFLWVQLSSAAQKVAIGETITLHWVVDGVDRLGLDGVRKFFVLRVEDGGERGTIRLMVWG